MNVWYISLCVLELLYGGSPLADCQAGNTEIELGKWKAVDPVLGDHGINQSQPVLAVDMQNLILKKFVYDGACPFGQFRATNAVKSHRGTNIGYRLGPYDGSKDIVMRLPMKLTTFKYLVVWCREENRAYAFLKVPEGQSVNEPPDKVVIGPFMDESSGVKGNVSLLDGRTFKLSGFFFDGNATNATFIVGNTDKPDALGTIVPIELDGMDNYGPIPQLEDVTLRLRVPSGKTVCDFKWLAIYSHKAKASLGHVMIPKDIRLPADHGQNLIAWPAPGVPSETTIEMTNETSTTGGTTSSEMLVSTKSLTTPLKTSSTTPVQRRDPIIRITPLPGLGFKAKFSLEMVFAANIVILWNSYMGQRREKFE